MKKSFGPRTLIYPTPVWVIGTYDKAGKSNVMTIAWGGLCCSKPPCVAISIRKATYTYGNIIERKAFTVNVPSEAYAKESDYFGMVSGKDTDKFAAAGLTPAKSGLVDAPYVKEFPLILECKVINIIEIGLHTQFIGEIIDVKAEESVLNEKGFPDIEKVKPILFSPEMRAYYKVGGYLGEAFSIGKALQSLRS
ncbi:MAG: flavoredoxin [Nitrospirae bacterium CG_4_10_14_3_um_filter_44_29]|nr:flavin reductase family protein [Nitrospirota bacterium]OIO31997.1 MAG: flavoredoxin [Nitrospirae bacterium CG1_02_44_142]PIP69478.1 MAG: flavoredoxin [Nitrospirae bacterium CG22_combo_CG10-13_8_21_14_all_44_11]PIV42816.1 MAG: flavoredoxin [Nitrospirae bacterium CG02_land_8_20_14_3_00_44_33]PIV67261.1 MAG: flavoredoxin [Nitrospirae bacterium CG01_land_8_20_14_3_00_44_22]PIW89197.1 MAG: flavoredoxin [Nitrospirae bacterium CG_4_8_14_3_um_filter_44_28]PIX89468.1 MAG: flavoredoxin [Nitrospirae